MKIHKLTDTVNSGSEFLKILKHIPQPDVVGPWIAGGSLWKAMENIPLKSSDVDFFFANNKQLEWFCSMMKGFPFRDRVVYEKDSKYNRNFKFHIYEKGFNKTVTLQFIAFKFWDSMENLLNDFDFTACQFGYDGINLMVGDKSIEHVKERKIVLHKVSNFNSTYTHIGKYKEHGFEMSKDQSVLFEKLRKLPECNKKDYMYNYEGDYDYPEPPVRRRNVGLDSILNATPRDVPTGTPAPWRTDVSSVSPTTATRSPGVETVDWSNLTVTLTPPTFTEGDIVGQTNAIRNIREEMVSEVGWDRSVVDSDDSQQNSVVAPEPDGRFIYTSPFRWNNGQITVAGGGAVGAQTGVVEDA